MNTIETNKKHQPHTEQARACHDRHAAPYGPHRLRLDCSSASGLARKSNSIAVVRLCIVLSLLAAGIQQGFADESAMSPDEKKQIPWERGFVRFGGFAAAFNSSLGFGISGGPSVEIKAEDGLDLDSSLTVLRLDAVYRIGESRRHQVDFTYASYHREGRTTLSEDIDLGDQTLPVGADVSTVFNFDIIRGTYTYAFLQDDRMRIAMGLGIYAVPLEYGLKVETTGGRSEVEGADVTLPLPALAVRAEFQLIPKLFLNMEANFMYLEISDFKGSLLDNTFALEYRPWKHVGFGVGYSGMAVSVEQDSIDSDYVGADFIGSVDVKFSGLLLYGKLSF
jgi:hypothetical protein